MSREQPTELCQHCGRRMILSRLDSDGWCDHCTGVGNDEQQARNHDGLDAARAALEQARKENQ